MRYGDDHLTLWTVQPKAFWEQMQHTGWLRCDGRKSTYQSDPDMRAAYRWMRQQMKLRIPGYSGRFPIWAWPEKKPRKRDYAYDKGVRELVRIKFTAAPRAVLISSFEAWHGVMTPSYIGKADRGEIFHTLFEEAQEIGMAETVARLKADREKSWEAIFDIPLVTELGWHLPQNDVQAVIEEVHISQVRTVQPLF